MTPEQFAYWLQGFAELNPNTPPNITQWKQIQDHLQLVFKKETPLRVGPGIAAPAYPNYPSPPNWINPVNPITPYTVPGIRPEVICSVAPGAGTNWSSGAGSYDYTINATQYEYKKLNDKERFRL